MKKILILILIFAASVSVNSQWLQQNTPDNTSWYFDLEAISQQVVYCAGHKVLKTVNGGTTWSTLNIAGYSSTVWGISFISSSTGWGCGFSGKILKTTNGGTDWNVLTVGTESFRDILFINQTTGIVCGDLGRLYRSTNSGANWTARNPGTSTTLNGIANDGSYVWIAGGEGLEGIIIKSTNNGESWETMAMFGSPVEKIQFLNASTGFATTHNTLYKSTNGGANWNEVDVPSPDIFLTVKMVNTNVGYASNFNTTLKTINGGVNWYEQNTVLTNTPMFDIEFAPGSTSIGWMCGMDGALVYTNNSGGGFIGIEPISINVPGEFSLSQNYPNPFNPTTKIKLALPKEGFVNLAVFDVTGKQVALLVNENLNAGEYNVDFNASGLTSGVYFYKVVANDFTDVKKMMLIK